MRRIQWAGDQLIAGGADGAYIGTVEGGLGRLPSERRAEVLTVAVSPADPDVFATGARDGTVVLWTRQTEVAAWQHSDEIFSLAFRPDGQQLAIGARDGTVRLAQTSALAEGRVLGTHRRGVDAVAWHPSDGTLASGSADADVQFWMAERSEAVRGLGNSVHDVVWLDAKHVVTAGGDWRIRIIDAAAGRVMQRIRAHGDEVLALSLSHDGRLLASRAYDGIVRVWRTATWQLVNEFSTQPSADAQAWRAGIAFHPGRLVLASPDEGDRVIALFDLEQGGSGRASRTFAAAKVVLLGETGVGKSALAAALATGEFAPTEPTHSAVCRTVDVEPDHLPTAWSNVSAQLHIWDFAGQQIHRLVHHLFLDHCHIALLLTDFRSRTDPFLGLGAWAATVRAVSPSARMYLVISRGDVPASRPSDAAILKFQAQAGLEREYFEATATEPPTVRRLLDTIKQSINWEAIVPETESLRHEEVRAAVTALVERGDAIASVTEILEQLRRGGVTTTVADTRSALKLFHELGELHFLHSTDTVILRRDMLERASSELIWRANRGVFAPGSVPVIEALSGNWQLPADFNLPSHQRPTVFSSALEGLRQANLCFEEQGILVFPTELSQKPLPSYMILPQPLFSIHMQERAEAAYASAVAKLRERFSGLNHEYYENTAIIHVGSACRTFISLAQGADGGLRLEVAFDAEVPQRTRIFVTDTVEYTARKFDAAAQVEVHQRCGNCGEAVVDSRAIRRAIDAGRTVPCQYCGKPVVLRTSPYDDGLAVRGPVDGLTIFVSYAAGDESWLLLLDTHLTPLLRDRGIELFHRLKITPGTDWREAADARLAVAHIILLLLSPEFLASKETMQHEVPIALGRHRAGDARVVPIIVRACDWRNDRRFADIEPIPASGVPLAGAQDLDAAFAGAAASLRQVVASVRERGGRES